MLDILKRFHSKEEEIDGMDDDDAGDDSTSSECEEKQDLPNSGHLNESDHVKSRIEQCFPHPGEPVCTDDDICSIECKADLLHAFNVVKEPLSNQRPDVSSGPICTLPMHDFGEDTWDYEHHRCWKCGRPGHLAEDCLVMTSNEVKCCKSTCKVTDVKDPLTCQYCFDKAFDKFYDMYTATWKGTGLSIIWGSICCEDHFAWHRMNCMNANVEESAYIISKNSQKGKCIQLSDFIF
ncbi:hypothetical protein C1H46_000372 [Malus baccata]|uniref:CCHC-type domain-containing protein n=1 Tax=Malus baccata TaxID=106549 RepID=A0A540NSQ9_MALBA|nr:hypothetical protein C1H46_000372 [Malus baccata]